MEHRRHHHQQSPSISIPTRKTQVEEEDQWWKSDGEEKEEEDEEGSMATKAIRASSGSRRDSSLSSAYAAPHPLHPKPQPPSSRFQSQSQNLHRNPTITRASWIHDSIPPSSALDKRNAADSNSKPSFWSTIARKAKSIIDDEDDVPSRSQSLNPPSSAVPSQSHKPVSSASATQFSSKSFGSREATGQNPQNSSDGARLHKGFGAIANSLTYIGGTIGNALEEGLTIVETRTADIIHETRKLNVRQKFRTPDVNGQDNKDRNANNKSQMQTSVQPQMQSDLEIQLKASRDVSMAMAAKTKVLLRELKTVKADLAFAKERCAQLEEENKLIRESLHKGDNLEDDDLIRLQLESLLAEKARLAHENSVYARENRFLREIVEYHQLTMQDVVYLDEKSEEVTEVYPAKVPSLANLHAMDNIQPPLTSPKSLQED